MPEPITEPYEEEATPEQLEKLNYLQKQIEKLESYPAPIAESKTPSTNASLSKNYTEEIPQKLDLVPEPITEPYEEEATPEQLEKLNYLQKQIEKLESYPAPIAESKTPSTNASLSKNYTEEIPQKLDLVPEPITEPYEEEATPEQLEKLNYLQKQIEKLEHFHPVSIQEHPLPRKIEHISKESILAIPPAMDYSTLKNIISNFKYNSEHPEYHLTNSSIENNPKDKEIIKKEIGQIQSEISILKNKIALLNNMESQESQYGQTSLMDKKKPKISKKSTGIKAKKPKINKKSTGIKAKKPKINKKSTGIKAKKTQNK